MRSSAKTSLEPAALTDSSRAVLRALATHGPITRPRLGALLALSKPTMSAAVAELGALGLVAPVGRQEGAVGRRASIYGLGPAAGYVIGIDVRSALVRAVAHGLDGSPLAATERPLSPRHRPEGEEVAKAVDAAAESVSRAGGRGPLRAIAVAVPRIVSAARPRLRLSNRQGPEALLRRLRARERAPIILENNVNCAALGELRHGAAAGRRVFAYLQVGVRIGLGIVIDGQLFRGFNGAAGEIGRLPFPWSTSETPRREELEHYLGSEALVARSVAGWPASDGPPPHTAEALFARAAGGSPHAHRWVTRHARDIGRLVAACVGVLDPGLIVLGGGVGQNPLVVDEVRRVARALTWTTDIAVSSLGPNGTVLGAMQLAADYALGLILGEALPPALVLPPRGRLR
jgi:predicted NBD/HSP70 family sugar kinase